jgi:hypothetical protein
MVDILESLFALLEEAAKLHMSVSDVHLEVHINYTRMKYIFLYILLKPVP